MGTLMDTRTKLEAQEVAYSKLSQEKKEIEDIKTAKDSSLQQLKSEKEKDTRELEDQVDLCREEIESLKGTLLDTKIKLEEQDTVMQKMEDIGAAKDLSLEQLQSENEQNTRELEEQANLCREEIESLKVSLLDTKTKLEEQDAAMRKKKQELEDRINICREENQSLQGSFLDTKTKLEEQEVAFHQLSAEKADL